jgi:hypothetical protein
MLPRTLLRLVKLVASMGDIDQLAAALQALLIDGVPDCG